MNIKEFSEKYIDKRKINNINEFNDFIDKNGDKDDIKLLACYLGFNIEDAKSRGKDIDCELKENGTRKDRRINIGFYNSCDTLDNYIYRCKTKGIIQ